MAFNEWLTDPEHVLPRVRRVLPTIHLDPASNVVAQAYVQAERFAVAPDHPDPLPANAVRDGLAIPWRGDIFCNPPYEGGLVDAFTAKLIEEWESGRVRQALYLVNSSIDAGWYHDTLAACTALLVWRGRIKFWKIFDGRAHAIWEGEKSKKDRAADPTKKPKIGNSPLYQSTLFYFGPNPDAFAEAFEGCGTVLAARPSRSVRQLGLFRGAA